MSPGIAGTRSSIIMDILQRVGVAQRKPRVILLENVPGLLISNKGLDVLKLLGGLLKAGYLYVDIRIVCASHFTAQNRKRVFITACQSYNGGTLTGEEEVTETQPHIVRKLQNACRLSIPGLKFMDISVPWLPAPARALSGILDQNIPPEAWFKSERRRALFDQFSPEHKLKLAGCGHRCVAFVQSTYKGVVMARPNFQGRSPCLRRALGGGNVPKLIFLEDGKMREMTKREYIRLQGGPEHFEVPSQWKRAKVASALGDAVCIPVVTWIAVNILLKLL